MHAKQFLQYYEACRDLAVDHHGPLHTAIHSVTCNSKTVTKGSLFVAINGAKTRGIAHLAEAIERGAVAVVYKGNLLENLPVPSFRVRDDYAALARIAEFHFDYPARELLSIGVTGTNGKSTTVALTQSILQTAGIPTGLIGTIYYDTGATRYKAPHTTPPPLELQRLLAEMRDTGMEAVVMEVSSHALIQNRLGAMQFDVAVFTNLSAEHLDYHFTIEEYYSAKTLLFTRHLKAGGSAIINTDDEYGARLATQLLIAEETVAPKAGGHQPPPPHADGIPTRRNAWPSHQVPQPSVPTPPQKTRRPKPSIHPHHPTYAMHRCWPTDHRLFTFSAQDNQSAHCLLIDRQTSALQSRLQLITPAGAMDVNTVLVGEHNYYNVMAATMTAVALKIPPMVIEDGIQRFSGVPGRLERLTTMADFDVFVDYAHTDDALRRVLAALKTLCHGRLIVVFGCGGDRDKTKRPRMGKVAAELADEIVLTTDNPRGENPQDIIDDIRQGIPLHVNYQAILDRREAIRTSLVAAKPSDVVLIAGKGHEDYQEINGIRINFNDTQVCREILAEFTRQQ